MFGCRITAGLKLGWMEKVENGLNVQNIGLDVDVVMFRVTPTEINGTQVSHD